MQFNQTVTSMESKIEGGFHGNNSGRKQADSCSAGAEGSFSSNLCDVRQNGSTEAPNIQNICPSHDLNSENNVSKDTDMFVRVSSVEAAKVEQRLIPEASEKLVQDATCSFHDCKIEDSQKKPTSPKACLIASLEKESSPSGAGFSDKSTEFPSSKHNASSQIRSPCSKSQTGYSFHEVTDCKDSEGNESCELQREPSPFCQVDGAGQLTAGSSKSIGKLETETGVEHGIPPQNTVVYEKFEESTSLVEASNVTKVQTQTQPALETESEDSAAIEDDVKVCDTCGDAGLEEKLAICSRCSDGAEHIYCMRIQLKKLPKGDWLCEECKLKDETEKQNVDTFKMVSKSSEVPGSNENSKNTGSTLNSKLLSKLVTKSKDEEEKTLHKEDKKHAGDDEVASMGSKRALESISGIVGTSKEAVYSRGSSFGNLDKGKLKPSKPSPSLGVTSANNSQPVACTQISSVSNSSNVQTGLQSLRGPLLKSASFNNSSMKPKVIQLTGTLPHMQKPARDSAASNTRKGEVVRSMTKSASLKGTSSTSVESVSKIQPVPRWSDMRDAKLVRERNLIEKKNSSTLDRPLLSPKPVNATGTSLPKPDLKVTPTSELNILGINRSDHANNLECNEVKLQLSRISKSLRSSSSNGICNSEDRKPCEVVSNNDLHANFAPAYIYCRNSDTVSSNAPHVLESIDWNEKTKNLSFSSCSKQAVSSGSRILHCQRCNEGGHATQNCPINKLRMTALKLSSDRNLKNRTDKSNRWKDAVETAISKTTVQKNNKLSNQNEKLLIPRTDANFQVASRDSQSRNLLSAERASDGQETPASIADVNIIDRKPEPHTGALSAPSTSELYSVPTLLDEFTVKPSLHTLPDRASFLANLMRTAVIPKLEFIWQGGFEVLRTGRHPELCEGVQAHLSSCASPKVFEVANKFPCRVQVDEVPRLCSWPLQFKGDYPKDDNIALFFFAKDTESYEKTYRNLLENMLQNDLALKADIDGVELLIFPSNWLPENSQRWNRLLFLWGVFRRRKENCLGTALSLQEKPDECTLTVEPFLGPLISECSLSLKIESSEKQDKELSVHEKSLRAVEHATCMDFHTVPSSGIEDVICHSQESQPLQTAQVSIDREFLSKDTSFASLKAHSCDSECGRDVATHSHASTSNFEQGAGANDSQEQLKPMEGKGVLDNDLLGDVMEVDRKSWESRLHRKRGHSDSSNTIPSASDEKLKSTGETPKCIEKVNCTSSDSEKEHKKMKLDIGGYSSCGSKEEIPNVKVHLLSASCLDNSRNETLVSESSSAERHFFSVDLDLVKDAKPDTSVFVLSSDDDDMPELNVPNLELALGGKEKTPNQESSSLVSSMSIKKIRQDKQPSLAIDDRDDGSASLSLSLAFPPSE